jgi:outer membrane receptor protein involved in Fe transport
MYSHSLRALAVLVVILFAPTVILFAQAVRISGMVKDTTQLKQAIAGASVYLLSADSSVVKGTSSDSSGKFALADVVPGTYKLRVSMVGYKTFSIGIPITDGALQNVEVNDIHLVPVYTELKQVTVTGKRALVSQQLGKVVVNVNAAISNVGSNALEVLERLPGVSVDRDGNISLNGKQGVTVMIDGKLSYVTGSDLAKLLSSINASQLNQVEIMSNPGAQYDAAGNAGIINIKTSKYTIYGWNVGISASYGQGKYGRTDNSVNLNYRTRKVNAFFNYGFNVRNGFNKLNITRTFFNPFGERSSGYDEPSLQTFRKTTNSAKFGVDYYLSPHTTIGFVVTGRQAPQHTSNISDSYFKDLADAVDSSVHSQATVRDRFKNFTANVNFEQHLDSTKTLSADLDYLLYSLSTNQLFHNITTHAAGGTVYDALQGNLPVQVNIYVGKVDYTQMLKSLKMEAGVKVSQVYTDNTANYARQDGTGAFLPDYEISNYFKYQEKIMAAYLNFDKSVKKWSFQVGLRYENTDYKGRQYDGFGHADTAFKRRYNNLFPTAFIGYKLNSDHEFSASFGRRIDRPAYQSLNPFLDYINKYTYEVGNPLLLPQYSDNLELGYLFKGKFSVTASYATTHNYFTQIFRSENKVTIFTTGNLATLRTGGLSVNNQFSVSDWWSVNLNGNILYKKVRGVVNGENLETGAFQSQAGVTNLLSFGKGWAGELSGTMRSRDVEGQFKVRHYGQASAGLSKQLFHDQGSVKLNIRDIFYSQVLYGSVLYNNVQESYVQRSDLRVVNLVFTYRFGKLSNAAARKKNSSTEQEQVRVKE